MDHTDEIVVTGMGMVTALGHDVPACYAAARAGRTGIAAVPTDMAGEVANLPVRVVAAVGDLVVDEELLTQGRECSRGMLYALVAAEEAIVESGIASGADDRRVGVITGCALPSIDLHARVLAGGRDARVPGSVAPNLSAHAPSSAIGLRHRFRGPNLSLSAACATGAAAVATAADQIRAGRAEAMVVGATESAFEWSTLASFVRAHALNLTDDPVGACAPFDRNRAGLVMGEGAAFLVVESARSAQRRGARVRARLLGDALTNDAHHMWAPHPESWAATVATALDRAEVAPEQIDYVSAHAAGTRAGDAAETWALKAAMGPRAHDVPVSATKGMHGHAFASSSAIELVLALTAMGRGEVLPTVGLREPDPECDLDHVPGEARPWQGETLLKTSFGVGGTSAALVLQVPA